MLTLERTKEVDQKEKLVGSRVRRIEDRRLLTGKDLFIDNLVFPKMVYAGFVRSPYAHARIKSIDLSKVRNDSSVVGVLTPDEVRSLSRPIPLIWQTPNSRLFQQHYALAQREVKHVGDPVVAIAVKDRYSIEDILDLVEVDYEPIEPVIDPLSAEQKPSIHKELDSNCCYVIPISSGNVDLAFQNADLVVSGQFKIARLAASPMETRGVIALPNALQSDLTVYSSTQWPHTLRTSLSTCLKIPESSIRVIGPDVGGAFGVKGEVYCEEVAISLLAMKYSIPVKWIESRKESFVATAHARDQIIDAQASFLKDGTISGIKAKILCDFGAYLNTLTVGSPFLTALSFPGPYFVTNQHVEAKGVYTNKVGLSAYRGFGQPEAAFVVERLMSMAANKLGIDSSEIRLKNFIPRFVSPFTTSSGGVYDSGDYSNCFKKALDVAGYEEMIARRNEARKQGRLRGIGVSFFTESTGTGPSPGNAFLGIQAGGFDSATVKMDPQGKLLVTTGAFPHGQGFNTTLAQICADELGLALEDVFVHHGDTMSSPYGQGSWGSRSIAVAGSAAVIAARKLREKILRIAGQLLTLSDIEDLYLSRGSVRSRVEPEKKVSIPEVAKTAYLANNLPPGIEPGLEATAFFEPSGLAISYAANICEVEIDQETGKVSIIKHVSVHDCGNSINPTIVEGQIHGGLAQAIGACLLEELIYDDEGQLLTTSFLDYLVPTSDLAPSPIIDSTSIPSPLNPLGVKGVGENATIIAMPAIINAISDALQIDVLSVPLSPERIWKFLRKKE